MQHLLILGKVWPEPASSAAGSRILQLTRIFLSQNWKVSFACAANKGEFSHDLARMGVQEFDIELNSAAFDLFLKELQPSIVLFDRFITEEQFGWRVAEQCPGALRILDTEDLHCLRAGRDKALKEKRAFAPGDLSNEIAKRELASIYRCDLSLIIADYEMQLLQEHFKVDSALLHYIPLLSDAVTEAQSAAWPAFSERSHFISIGNFLHEPNWDAVLYLKNEIWPIIRKRLPYAEMHVYGAYPSHKVFDLHRPKDGFLVKGRADSVNEVMANAKVCLAPLRFGAGLKGKLMDAMLNGTPSVTTPVGAESMHRGLHWGGEIADNAEDLAQAAVKLYTDETLWQQAQQNGARIIHGLFLKEAHTPGLVSRILDIQGNLAEHRVKNFTGAMLMHHTALSSRYMALWIEAKNK